MALGAGRKENNTRAAIVARDQIARRRARSGCESADKVVSALRIHAYVRVGQSDCSCDVGANEIALHRVVRSAPQIDAAVISGNDIAGGNGGATNEIV